MVDCDAPLARSAAGVFRSSLRFSKLFAWLAVPLLSVGVANAQFEERLENFDIRLSDEKAAVQALERLRAERGLGGTQLASVTQQMLSAR